MKKKNTGMVVLGVIVAIVVIIGGYGIGTYNSLVKQETHVEEKWAQVESKLQRRYDLVPNLVNAVKGSMKQEKDVIKSVTDARAKLSGAKSVEDTAKASTEMEAALSRLLVVVENYPELKSNENVKTLMTQLEGTENRISVERGRYNEAIAAYNVSIKRFPKSMVAKAAGFEKKEFFESEKGAEKAPKVDFED